ncbi:MAG TPA: DUF6438 domain-containing protein [Sphingobacteriaceae bacterium]
MKLKYPFPIADLRIKLERGPCLGECPVYDITITGTGDVIYDGVIFVREVGRRHSKVDEFDVLELFMFAADIGFFEMKKEYSTGDRIVVRDGSTGSVTG